MMLLIRAAEKYFVVPIDEKFFKFWLFNVISIINWKVVDALQNPYGACKLLATVMTYKFCLLLLLHVYIYLLITTVVMECGTPLGFLEGFPVLIQPCIQIGIPNH